MINRSRLGFEDCVNSPLDRVLHSIWLTSVFQLRAAIHHPDKAVNAGDTITSEAYFVNLKTAQDTLLDPVKRFAYERFGPDMLEWQHCSSVRDYLLAGLQSTAPVYIGSIIFLIILSTLGYLQWGRFVGQPLIPIRASPQLTSKSKKNQWRYLNLFCLFLLEYHTLTRPYFSPLLTKIINPLLTLTTTHPPLLPFQLLILARKTSITLFIAASQLSGFFQPAPSSSSSSPNSPQKQHELQQLARLEHTVQASEMEATRLLALDMAPFVGDDDAVNELRGRVREWLVTNTIRADPEVRDAMGRALGKRRTGVPAGAKI